MRTGILELLFSRDYVSGEEMSDKLGVSRTAVWKHIEVLRKEGHLIESKPGRGYLLVRLNNCLSPERLKLGLNCKVFAREVSCFDELASTNLEAKRLAARGYPEGTLVIAEKQLQGRGRMGRSWESSLGGIWLSILLKPKIAPQVAPQLSLLAAAAVQQTLAKDFAINTKIKWPNDILLDHLKLSGILTEMKGEIDRIEYVVLGVGINANQTLEDFPLHLRDKVVSIRMASGKECDRLALLQRLLERLETYYLDFIENGFDKTRKVCLRESSLIGKQITFSSGESKLHARAVDLGKDGSLVVEVNGKRIALYSGEVSVGQ